MPKQKTLKGVKERFRITGTGKVIVAKAGKRHLLGSKRSKYKRQHRKPHQLAEVDARKIRQLLPFV